MTEITQTPTTSMPRTVGRKALTILRELALMLVVVGLAVVLTRATVENIAVNGVSMDPTLHAGERVLVNKVAYRFSTPQRGDVVIAREPEQQVAVVKRLVGLPGDELTIEEGQLFINGQLFSEPYVPPADFVPAPVYAVPTAADIAQGDGRWLIPEGHYFLLGDDRNFSTDSRAFGPISADAIRGKVQLLVWPPKRWDIVAHHSAYGIAPD